MRRALIVLAVFGALAAAASASTSDNYTWTANTGSWSTAANWNPSAVPSGTVGALAFPASSCTTGAGCTITDDIPNLSATTLSLAHPTSGGGWTMMASDALTLASGLTVSGGGTTYIYSPLALGGSNAWSLSGKTSISNLTGNFPLSVSFTGGASQMYFNSAAEVGATTIDGGLSSPISTLGPGTWLGAEMTFIGASGLNGTNGNAVTVSHGVLVDGTPSLGSLTVSNSKLDPGKKISVTGSLTLDSDSIVQYTNLAASTNTPVAGTDYPTVTATGNVSLGSAHLSPFGCDTNVGRTFTLVSTSGGTVQGTFDDMAGNPLPDGAILVNAHCALRINYTSTAVTATVVSPPAPNITITPSASYKVNDLPSFDLSLDRPYTGRISVQLDGVALCNNSSAVYVTSGTVATPCAPNSTSLKTAGDHTVTATFSPPQYPNGEISAAGSGQTTFSVAKAPTTTQMVLNEVTSVIHNPGEPDQIETGEMITGITNPATPAMMAVTHMTGTVTVMDGAKAAASCTVGQPGLQMPPCNLRCAMGPWQLVYSGDANYEASASEVIVRKRNVPCETASGNGTTGGTQTPPNQTSILTAKMDVLKPLLQTAVTKAKSAVVRAITSPKTKSFTLSAPAYPYNGTYTYSLVTKGMAAATRETVLASGSLKVAGQESGGAARPPVKIKLTMTPGGRALRLKAAKKHKALKMVLRLKMQNAANPKAQSVVETPVTAKPKP